MEQLDYKSMVPDPDANGTVAMSKGKSSSTPQSPPSKLTDLPMSSNEPESNMKTPPCEEEHYNMWEDQTISSRISSHLPPEIILNILDYVVYNDPWQTQCTLYAATLVSRSWYTSAVPLLYESPTLNGKNYDKFIATVCPSINLHVRRSRLASMVRYLDMGLIVHSGSKSLTARLLGRVKGCLEVFRAPMAPFGYADNPSP